MQRLSVDWTLRLGHYLSQRGQSGREVRGDRAHLRLSDILETITTVMDTLFITRMEEEVKYDQGTRAPQFFNKQIITGEARCMIRGPELLTNRHRC